MTRNKWILIVLGVLLVAAAITSSYLYIDSKKDELSDLERRNFQRQQEVLGILGNITDDTDSIPTYDEISHILRDSFSWSSTVDELERIEVQLGLESKKLYRLADKSKYPIYAHLDRTIQIYSVIIVFDGTEQDIYNYIEELQKIEQTSVLNYFDIGVFTDPESEYENFVASVELLYFVHEEPEEE